MTGAAPRASAIPVCSDVGTRSVYEGDMSARPPPPSPVTSRYAAVAALFTALGALIDDYQTTPDPERAERWSRDAERITAEVARQLGIARTRLAAVPPRDTKSR
jgi:hypothetical protein